MPDHAAPPWRDLLHSFGRIGLLSFGGPAAQIALMHRTLVDERKWLTEKGFLSALSFCMMLPGPEAMQLATYSGWRLRGVPGGLLAGLLFVLPGALVIAALALLYARWGDVPAVEMLFLGVKAAVVMIVAQALLRLGQKSLATPTAKVIAGLAFLAIFLFDAPFPLILAAAAAWGALTATTSTAEMPPAPDRPRTLRTCVTWGALWAAPFLILYLNDSAFLSDIAWFFAKLAVITFGGAYAVLSYLAQQVVADHGWITAPEMIDALGLAETTPGPLILVTQFVAMLAGHHQGGPGLALAAGAVALWMTFVPCFLWIFAGAPWLERITARPRIGAALSAISAAVVGVILDLSVWFAGHVWFEESRQIALGPLQPELPILQSPEPAALALSALAAGLLFGLRLGLAPVLGLTAAAAAVLVPVLT